MGPSPWQYRFALVTLVATFALLFIGGTVNPTGSSLACPEPTLICNGELFPEMKGGVLYEHGHRLAGMTVGLLQIALTLSLWRRRRLRRLGVAALVLVCAQGALGAITVAYKLPWAISTLHLLTAQSYVALLAYITWRTKPQSERVPAEAREPVALLSRWLFAAAGLVLFQILLGGLMRHNGGALASVDFPLHDGSLWPASAPIALKLHMAHRIAGVIVGLFAMAVSGAVFRQARGWPKMRLLAAIVPILIATQILFGALVILYLRPVSVVLVHFSVGISLWVILFFMNLMIRRHPEVSVA